MKFEITIEIKKNGIYFNGVEYHHVKMFTGGGKHQAVKFSRPTLRKSLKALNINLPRGANIGDKFQTIVEAIPQTIYGETFSLFGFDEDMDIEGVNTFNEEGFQYFGIYLLGNDQFEIPVTGEQLIKE